MVPLLVYQVGLGQWYLCGTSIGLLGWDRAVVSLWYLYWSIRGRIGQCSRIVYLYCSVGGKVGIGQWYLCGTSIGLLGGGGGIGQWYLCSTSIGLSGGG